MPVAVVTGGYTGIGLAVVIGLAKKLPDHTVILTARTAAKGKQGLEAAVKAGVNNVEYYAPCEATNDEQIAGIAKLIKDKYDGDVRILVNNIGVYLDKGSSVLDVSPEVVAQTFDINTLSALRFIQVLVPMMQARKYGRVVNVSSGMGQLQGASGGSLGYRLSKAAMNSLTVNLAAEMAKDTSFDFAANTLCPGFVITKMTSDIGGGRLSTDEGASGIVSMATVPKGGPNGTFTRHTKPIPW